METTQIPEYATAKVAVVNAFGSLYGTWELVSDESIGADRRMALLVKDAHEYLPKAVTGVVTLRNGVKRVATEHVGFYTGRKYIQYLTPGRQWRMASSEDAATFQPEWSA